MGEAIVQEVMKILRGIKGVRYVCTLTSEEREEVLRREIENEKMSTRGFIRQYNAGLRCVLERDVVLMLLIDENYEYPPETVQLICLGEVVGEEIRDKEKLEELKGRKDVLLLGTSFVVYKDKLQDFMKRALSGSLYMLIPPMSVKELEGVAGVCNVTEAMPSSPATIYLLERLRSRGVDVCHRKLGVALVGFDIRG
jgi:hypothetical protein